MKEFLHSGEKIKHLRGAAGLAQEDLANNQVTKSFISLIERKKRNLTWRTARIIADSFNKYYKPQGKEITAEYLMETEIEHAKNGVREGIGKLEKAIRFGNIDDTIIENGIEKLNKTAVKWQLEEEIIEVKRLRGDFYFSSYLYKEALLDYMDIFHSYMSKQNFSKVAEVFISIGEIYHNQILLDAAIMYFEKASRYAEHKNTSNNTEIKIRSILGLISCYIKVNEYEEVFNYIRIIKDLDWNNHLRLKYYNKVLLLEGNAYRDIKNYYKARKNYDRILQDKEKLDTETLFLTYDHYGILYQRQEKSLRALVYIRKAIEFKGLVDSKYLSAFYLNQAECYKQLEHYDKVLDLLEHGLTLSEWTSNPYMLIKTHFALSGFYLKIKDFSKVKLHLNEAEKLILEKKYTLKNHELWSYYIDLFIELRDFGKIREYTDKIRDLNNI